VQKHNQRNQTLTSAFAQIFVFPLEVQWSKHACFLVFKRFSWYHIMLKLMLLYKRLSSRRLMKIRN